MKNIILIFFFISSAALQAQAASSTCINAVQKALHDEAYRLARRSFEFESLKSVELDYLGTHLQKVLRYATKFPKYYDPDLFEDVIEELQYGKTSDLEAIQLVWRGTLYMPTNNDLRGYSTVLVDKKTCKPITPILFYHHTAIGERTNFPPENAGRDW